jgi:hypothetical protein
MLQGPGASQALALTPDLRIQLENELRAGEKIVWTAQPRPGLYARAGWGLFIFAIPWTAFAVFWMVMAGGGLWKWLGASGDSPARNAPAPSGPFKYFSLCFPLFGLPFVLIGVAMLAAPWWMRRRARKVIYALTDQRAIIFEAGMFGRQTIRSYDPDKLGSIERTQRPDGSGDLVFETLITRDSEGARQTTRRGFIGIESVKQVEETLRQTLLTPR